MERNLRKERIGVVVSNKMDRRSGQQQDGQVCRSCSRNEGKTPYIREIR